MTTWALLDPWLVSVPANPQDEWTQLNALAILGSEICRERPVTIVGFLDDQEFAALQAWFFSRRRDGAAVFLELFSRLHRPGAPVAPPATILGTTVPTASARWLQVLSECLQRPDGSWRDPVLFSTQERAAAWPPRNPIAVQLGAVTYLRALVQLERAREDARFCRTFDPWLYVEPLDLHPEDPRAGYCRLPRPPQLHSRTPIRDCQCLLKPLRDGFSEARNYYYYLPPVAWDLWGLTEGAWFDPRQCFPIGHKDTRLGPVSGPLDRQGRVWRWPPHGERHWDVQDPDPRKPGTYMNVSHTGRIMKIVEEGVVTGS